VSIRQVDRQSELDAACLGCTASPERRDIVVLAGGECIKLSKEADMADITTIAKRFFEACESGKGWAVCGDYCTPDASFSAQAEPLTEVRTLRDYTE
jgi:hypothetical protein